MNYYIADLHFSHRNILQFDKRPFQSVDQMNADLIRRWNGTVTANDDVYVLGDMFWNPDEAPMILEQLHGKIHLIKGNHDRFLHNSKAKAALAGIKDYDDICVTLEDGTKRRVILCHYFMPMYIGHRYNAIHLHAHSHFSHEADLEVAYARRLRQLGFRNEIYNVGCMYWNFEPVTLDEILAHGETVSPYYGSRPIDLGGNHEQVL